MAIVPGTPTHRATVDVFDREFIEKDQLVRYEGTSDRKFEPLNPVDAVKWRQSVADPAWALRTNLQSKAVLWPPMSQAEKDDAERMRRQQSVPVKLGD